MTLAVNEILDYISNRVGHAVTIETELSSLNMDSLKLVEMIFDIEDQFKVDIKFNANSASDYKTIGDLMRDAT